MKSQSLKDSNISSLTVKIPNVHHSESYNELLNLRTCLLQMQYLYCSLQQSLQRQYQNQQNQHKDHLIQCWNIKQEYENLKDNNFMKLLIVKLEEFLAIQEDLNEKLLRQKGIKQLVNQQQELNKEYGLIPKLDKFLTYVKIKEQQMQQSLCKLYIGNKVMIDLQKTSQSIDKIGQKIDSFMQKNNETIKVYNNKIGELEQTKVKFKEYLSQVSDQIGKLTRNQSENDQNQSTRLNIQGKQKNKHLQIQELYQRHLRHKLQKQNQQIEERIHTKMNNLFVF